MLRRGPGWWKGTSRQDPSLKIIHAKRVGFRSRDSSFMWKNWGSAAARAVTRAADGTGWAGAYFLLTLTEYWPTYTPHRLNSGEMKRRGVRRGGVVLVLMSVWLSSAVAMNVAQATPLVPPPPPPATEPPCSLNGELRGGACVCDKGWTGPKCGQLDLLPAPPLAAQVSAAAATSSENSVANSTWGISVIGPIAGTYHG
jgi:hypothetical protein